MFCSDPSFVYLIDFFFFGEGMGWGGAFILIFVDKLVNNDSSLKLVIQSVLLVLCMDCFVTG